LKPVSAFFQFKEDNYKQVQNENPTLKATDITKIIARKWAIVDQQTKDHYENQYREARELFEQETKLYESTCEDSLPPSERPLLSFFGSRR